VPSTDFPPRPAPSSFLETLPRFAVVMAALIALAAFPQSALFTINSIEVHGASLLSRPAVIAIAGLEEGGRLFAVDGAAVLRRLRADPRIKDASLRITPPHTVRLAITERRPLVALVVGDQYAWLGSDLVAVAVEADPGDLPEVVDRTRPVPWARAGAPVASQAARVAIAALPAIPAALRADLRRIVVTHGSDLTLVLRSGLEIRAGGPAGLGDRLLQVPRVLEALEAKGIGVAALDLRYAGSIAVTLVPEGEAR
jgi:cell division protein FtsQ